MKPRVLYFAVFVFFSLSGGRFTATFLEHELGFTENWMMSAAMAVQLLSSTVASSWLGSLADSLESKAGSSNGGRILIMSLGMLFSTICTLLHVLGSLYMRWSTGAEQNDVDGSSDLAVDNQRPIPMLLLAYHLILRALFSVGTSACMPVVDGLTLAQLDREGKSKSSWGKERGFGAVSWGLAHMFILGPSIDMFGYKTIYATTILAFIGCMITFQVYATTVARAQYVGVGENTASECDDTKNRDDEVAMKQPKTGSKYKCKTSFAEDDTFDNDVDTNVPEKERLTLAELVRLIFQKAPVLNATYIVCLCALFVGMSVVESLIFLYFEFLGGRSTMCGISVIVTVLFEIPLFHYAPDVLRLLGPVSMLQWACFAYVVRVIGYSFVPQSHPYWVLLLEPLHGVTIAFAFTSCVAFADTWAPKGYESSGQGLMSSIRSLGQFVGLCIGGVLEGRTLYRLLAAIVGVGSLALGIGTYFSSKPEFIEQEESELSAPDEHEIPKRETQLVEIT